ncbi:MAG: lipopolysaccharide transport periplasmic protein LptA [Rhodoferax sp.]|nr:lipopolysaccharide transport periplasmic protein LptA [Rhodoferax sp.]
MLLALPVYAEKADRNMPMNIEADSLRYDDLQQISVFTGRVVLTKGSILIRADRLEVRQDPEGFQYGVATGSAGRLAFFRQKREAVDEFMEGQGEVINYDGKADRVTFSRKAQLRRLRGAAVADEITGATIVYENLTDLFTVDGAAQTGGPSGSLGNSGNNSGNNSGGNSGNSGRVRLMLTPKPKPKPEAAASAPADPGKLRPSSTLEGKSK